MFKSSRSTLVALASLTLMLSSGCAVLNDPLVQHCAGPTVLGAVIGGSFANTTLADTEASQTATTTIGAVGGGAVGFYICRNTFLHAQALAQRIADLEEAQAASRTPPPADSVGPRTEPVPTGNAQLVNNLEVIDRRAVRLDLNSSLMFATGQSALVPRAHSHLDVLAESLTENPHARAVIIGHTDNIGDPAMNQRLSVQRAEAVVAYLSGQGVPRGYLEAKGVGDTEPIASNATEEGRAKNRRVEIVILHTDGSASPQRTAE